MNPRKLQQVFSAAAAAALLLCARDARADEPLRASGTGTALGAMRRLAAAFEQAGPDRLGLLSSIGSSGAIHAVARGALDFGFLGRELDARERALGLVAFPYARTPFVFVAGPRSGVSGITAAEAARIYSGELATWPGGERVRLVLRPRMDADTAILRAISTEMAAAVDRAYGREGLVMAATNQECNELVVKTPGGFGPSSLTQILAEEFPLRPLAWEGVAPTLANLASGAYPLSKTLWIVVRPSPRPAVRRFLAFLASPRARQLLEEAGNLPLELPAVD